MCKHKLLICLLSLIPFQALCAQSTGYQGQENREIKALSAEDVEGYRNGKGMGLAKAAELNHYPGPRHVLDLAKELKLTSAQLKQSQDLFTQMKQQAMQIGALLIEKERELDRLFAAGDVTSDNLKQTLDEIATLSSQLRYVHLSTHLVQKKILTAEQIKLYDQLRGYDQGKHQHHHHGD